MVKKSKKKKVLRPGHIPGAHKKGNIKDAGNSGWYTVVKPKE